MTFHDVIRRIDQGNLTGDEIVEFRNFCAIWLFRFNEEYGQLAGKAALWQTGNEEAYKSQAACERAWEATEDGQKQIKLKYQIRAIEHIQDALETNWFLVTREWKEKSNQT